MAWSTFPAGLTYRTGFIFWRLERFYFICRIPSSILRTLTSLYLPVVSPTTDPTRRRSWKITLASCCNCIEQCKRQRSLSKAKSPDLPWDHTIWSRENHQGGERLLKDLKYTGISPRGMSYHIGWDHSGLAHCVLTLSGMVHGVICGFT